MGKRIFEIFNLELFFIICKLCNLRRINIIIKIYDGEYKEDLIDICYFLIEKGEKVLRDILDEVINIKFMWGFV